MSINILVKNTSLYKYIMIYYFLGFMGSGKTTYGKIISKNLGLNFLDLDDVIVENKKMSIKEIFDKVGENGFRKIEKETLHNITKNNDNIIISVGGGTPCFFDNMEYMNEHGQTIYLQASINTLCQNLKANGIQKRPLLAGKTDEQLFEYIKEMLSKRTQKYSKAKNIFKTDNITRENILPLFKESIEIK